MATTQTPTELPAEAGAEPLPPLLPLPSGFAGVLGSGDHKTIGRLYLGFGLLFGLAAYVAGVFADLAKLPDVGFPPDDTATQFLYFRPVAMVFLFLMAVSLGLAIAIVPLQVGSRTVAFPRAAAASFWTWLLGSGVLITTYALNGGPEGGTVDTGEVATSLVLLTFPVVIAALLLGAVCVTTTVFGLRTVGMSLWRVPFFAWSMVVATGVWIVSLPVLVAVDLLVLIDFEWGARGSFGIPTDMWEHLGWFAGQPQIFAFAIPALGIIADIVPTFTKTRPAWRGGTMTAIALFGILGFGAYAVPAFNPEVTTEAAYVGASFAVIIPLLVLLGAWTIGLRGAKPNPKSPALLSGVSVLLILVGSIGGWYAFYPLALDGDSYSTGVMLLVVAGAGSGLAAGVLYWAPKLFGHMANEGLGKLAALAFLLAGLVGGIPQVLVGLANEFDQLEGSVDALNGATVAGNAIGALALLLVAVALLGATRGTPAGDDPWGGQTLEWATGSPPPRGNFGLLEPVRSAEPLLDATEEGA